MAFTLIFAISRFACFNLGQLGFQTAADKPDGNADANDIDDDGNLESLFHFFTSQGWYQIDIHRAVSNSNTRENGTIFNEFFIDSGWKGFWH